MKYTICIIDECSDDSLTFGSITREELDMLIDLAVSRRYTVSISGAEA